MSSVGRSASGTRRLAALVAAAAVAWTATACSGRKAGTSAPATPPATAPATPPATAASTVVSPTAPNPTTTSAPEDVAGDPGGRILAELRTVALAAPPAAHVVSSVFAEPKRDSCDGMPGTFGYDPVVVEVHFSWGNSESAVLASVRASLETSGWSWTMPTPATFRGQNYGTGDAVGTWSKTLQGDRPATAALLPGSVGDWNLLAEAPATLPPPTGCGR